MSTDPEFKMVGRRRKDGFAMIPNELYREMNNLSSKAKHYLAYFWHCDPKFIIRKTTLINSVTDGRDMVESGLEELRDAGWIWWPPQGKKGGRYRANTYYVREYLDQDWADIIPKGGNPTVPENPSRTVPENPSLNNTKSLKANSTVNGAVCSLGIKDTSFIQTSVDRFTQFAIENNLISKKPFTRKWISAMSNLLADHDRDIVSKTLDWFLDHRMTYKHVAQVKTLPLFCQRFAEIIEARRRWLKENPEKAPYPTKKRMKQVEVDGKMTFIEVTQWTSEE